MTERITKEQKGLLVLDSLMRSPKIMADLERETRLSTQQVRQGIEWIRDYDPACLVVERNGQFQHYKLADHADEVLDYQFKRAKVLLKMATRLERMVSNALDRWPTNRLLKIMHRHLSRMREDLEEIDV